MWLCDLNLFILFLFFIFLFLFFIFLFLMFKHWSSEKRETFRGKKNSFCFHLVNLLFLWIIRISSLKIIFMKRSFEPWRRSDQRPRRRTPSDAVRTDGDKPQRILTLLFNNSSIKNSKLFLILSVLIWSVSIRV